MTINIQTKEQIIEQLQNQYHALIEWVEQQDDQRFEWRPAEDKWNTGQHIDHLIKSTRPLTKALKMPRVMIRQLFGKINREERSYEQVVAKYQLKLSEGGKATGRFLPPDIVNAQKMDLLDELRSELNQLCKIIEKWKDDKLSNYLLPHPLLGKMTIREILLFTVYHTMHHFSILKERH